MSIYNYEYISNENRPVSMSEYKGNVMLIVNTASKCGFTPQYEGLEELYKKYKDEGFVVLGFPSNQFKEQEPGTDSEIASFCSLRYGVTFPLGKKVDVRGNEAIPLYKYLTSQKGFKGLAKGLKSKPLEIILRNIYKTSYDDDQIKWNFTKFLIDREGNVIARYEPDVEPKEIDADIAKLIQPAL